MTTLDRIHECHFRGCRYLFFSIHDLEEHQDEVEHHQCGSCLEHFTLAYYLQTHPCPFSQTSSPTTTTTTPIPNRLPLPRKQVSLRDAHLCLDALAQLKIPNRSSSWRTPLEDDPELCAIRKKYERERRLQRCDYIMIDDELA